MLLDLHTDFSEGRSGGLVFPSLEEFSTVCYPHKGFGVINKAEVDVFLEFSSFFCDPVGFNIINSLQSINTGCLSIHEGLSLLPGMFYSFQCTHLELHG